MILNSRAANDYFAKRKSQYKTQICRIVSAKQKMSKGKNNK